jgi:hypothetical protein
MILDVSIVPKLKICQMIESTFYRPPSWFGIVSVLFAIIVFWFVTVSVKLMPALITNPLLENLFPAK